MRLPASHEEQISGRQHGVRNAGISQARRHLLEALGLEHRHLGHVADSHAATPAVLARHLAHEVDIHAIG